MLVFVPSINFVMISVSEIDVAASLDFVVKCIFVDHVFILSVVSTIVELAFMVAGTANKIKNVFYLLAEINLVPFLIIL